MGNKVVKSYRSDNPSRTIKGTKPKKIGDFSKKKQRIKKNDKELENTTRIRIDSERINDVDSLDTSFLEGRIDKKVKNNRKAKEKILKEKRQVLVKLNFLKNIFFFLAFVCVVILVILVAFDHFKDFQSDDLDIERKVEIKEDVVEKTDEIDDNYLFVGDYNIDRFDFGDFDYHFVKCSREDLTSGKILAAMEDLIYRYNPSDVFINVGVVDLKNGAQDDDVVDNYRDIIDGIKENRPSAEITIMSLFPINKDVDDYDSNILNDRVNNEKIMSLNKKLKELSNDKGVHFFDTFELLSRDGKLNETYSNNGVYLNDEAYKILRENIKNRLDG